MSPTHGTVAPQPLSTNIRAAIMYRIEDDFFCMRNESINRRAALHCSRGNVDRSPAFIASERKSERKKCRVEYCSPQDTGAMVVFHFTSLEFSVSLLCTRRLRSIFLWVTFESHTSFFVAFQLSQVRLKGENER